MEQAALTFSRSDVDEIGAAFATLSRLVPLGPITSPDDYDQAVTVMNALMDAGAGDEDHPLAGLLGLIGGLVGDYDDTHHPIPPGSPVGALRFLMEQHGLQQRDMAEIGSQGVVSEVLNGRRELNLRQVAALAARFGVSPAVFIAV